MCECNAEFYTQNKGKDCLPVETCTGKTTAPHKVIPATATTNAVCGCEGGKYGELCGTECADDTFIVEGDNTAATACAAHKKCTDKGVKTAGDKTKDAVCNETASSAFALAFSFATLFAMIL